MATFGRWVLQILLLLIWSASLLGMQWLAHNAPAWMMMAQTVGDPVLSPAVWIVWVAWSIVLGCLFECCHKKP